MRHLDIAILAIAVTVIVLILTIGKGHSQTNPNYEKYYLATTDASGNKVQRRTKRIRQIRSNHIKIQQPAKPVIVDKIELPVATTTPLLERPVKTFAYVTPLPAARTTPVYEANLGAPFFPKTKLPTALAAVLAAAMGGILGMFVLVRCYYDRKRRSDRS